jgi:hypothetical protein
VKKKNHCILFFTIITFAYSNTYTRNKDNANAYYYTSPVTGKDPNSKMLGPLVRIEMQEDADFPWVGYDIDTMMRSKVNPQMYFSDSLPTGIQTKLLENNINYLILPFISETMTSEIPAHITVLPTPVGMFIRRDATEEYFDMIYLSFMLFDVRNNKVIKKHSEPIRQENCGGNMPVCIKNEIYELTKGRSTISPAEVKLIDSTSINKAIGLNHSGKTLFIVGSILTVTGFNAMVIGDSKAAMNANIALYTSGHAGLLTCGLSTIPLNRSVRSLYSQDIQGVGKGWICYGISIIANTAGLIIMNNGIKKNNEAVENAGLAIGLSGEIMRIPAWISFLKTRIKAARAIGRFSSSQK